jgi:hypothetical protein
MKKIISFSLYGDNPKYCVGAIENAKIQNEIYPGWISRFYYNDTVPKKYIEQLISLGAETIDMSGTEMRNHGMFWRFLVCDDKSVDIFMCRDVDSRLNLREQSAVNEWIESDKRFHIMRDHPYHDILVLGCAWGLKNNFSFNIENMILNFIKNKPFKYGDDQIFLYKLHKIFINDMICHDEFFDYPNNRAFPKKRNEYEFVGDVFDENNVRHPEYWQILKNYLLNK